MRKTAILILLLAIATMTPALADSFNGKVIGILDGNNIIVSYDNKARQLRLANVDCPDLNQDFGPQAKDFLMNIIFGKDVWVDIKSIDHSNRGLSTMTINGQDVGVQLVQAGLGWYDSRFTSNGAIAEAQVQAQINRTGLWSQNNPIPPWEFRQMSRGVTPDFSAGPAVSSGSSSSSTGTTGDYGYVPLHDQTCNSAFGIYVPTYYNSWYGPCRGGGFSGWQKL